MLAALHLEESIRVRVAEQIQNDCQRHCTAGNTGKEQTNTRQSATAKRRSPDNPVVKSMIMSVGCISDSFLNNRDIVQIRLCTLTLHEHGLYP